MDISEAISIYLLKNVGALKTIKTIAQWDSKLTASELAIKLKLPIEYIRNYSNRYELEYKKTDTPSFITSSELSEIKDLIMNGISYRKIGKMLGKTGQAIYDVKKRRINIEKFYVRNGKKIYRSIKQE